MATKLTEDDGEIQVSTLVYAMGPETENIFNSFMFERNEHKKTLMPC